MYENVTYETILNRILERMPETVDKRESSFLYNAAAPIAVELQNMYLALDNIINITFFDTSDRTGKLQRCKERGVDIAQFDATPAVCILHTTPQSVEIRIGTRFNLADMNYVVTEQISAGTYYVECETVGAVGNATGNVTPMEYIDGLETCSIDEIYRWGEDEAGVEQINEAYYASLNSQAFGGNRADYIAKMKSIAGIGGVKVYSADEWRGGGTCKLVFTTSAHTKPTKAFVDSIQEQIDPTQNQGAGYGIAPIGHIVTVAGAEETTVTVSMTIVLYDGYALDDVRTQIESVIQEYMDSLNEEWDTVNNIIVRVSQLETRVLDIAGIIDIMNVTINGAAENLTVDKDSLVKRGNVYVTV